MGSTSTLEGTPATADENELVVKLLLEVGANMDLTNVNSDTPLSKAAGNGSPNLVQLFLKRDANANS
ncbi:ankyrin repeat protein [Penicillium canescens]|uniref:Ankyrin repeat protein n=1 Tax=Penicillium canescens TaxID=5083 RepID=A0AAD6I444_PENCN|nr:ankyrin repeat protein [Penicillium canescens]KAJ6030315.1 ankyrin repeat protein [Penicillium canescens]KAJ6077688.1 ankyrin repeat protein [Penicillium canescens]